MNSTPMRSFRRSQRGSVLIVALVFSAILAISLTSYLKLALTAGKLANRSFYMDAAQNLVDLGLEHALWSLNNSSWTGAGFAARSGYANQYQATYPSAGNYYSFSGGVRGQVNVWVDNSGANPRSVAQATITLSDGTTFVKMSESYMRRASFFTNGMVARDRLTFGGNVRVDSWNSDPDATPATAMIPYSAASDSDGGRIASLLVNVESISVGNADIYGYAAIGGSSTADINVGSTGRIGPYGIANGRIDATRVTYDFTTSFPNVTAPDSTALTYSYSLGGIGGPVTLPRTGDFGVVDAIDGKTYYHYFTSGVSLAGMGDIITIDPAKNVVLTVTGTGTFETGGNAGIDIPITSSLKLYAPSTVAIGGNGVMNGTAGVVGSTANFQVYGTATSAAPQAIGIKGNSHLSGVVYAPNATVTITGTAAVYGAIVANRVNMNGTGDFHYDEALASLASANIWKVSKWREITTSTERATHSAALSF